MADRLLEERAARALTTFALVQAGKYATRRFGQLPARAGQSQTQRPTGAFTGGNSSGVSALGRPSVP